MSADEEGCWASSVLHTALASLSLTLMWLLPAKAAVASFPSSKPKAFRKQNYFFFPNTLKLLNYCTNTWHVLVTCQDMLNKSG